MFSSVSLIVLDGTCPVFGQDRLSFFSCFGKEGKPSAHIGCAKGTFCKRHSGTKSCFKLGMLVGVALH